MKPIFCLATILALVPAAGASNWHHCSGGVPVHWPAARCEFHPDAEGFPAGGEWRSALADAMTAMSTSASRMTFTIGSETSAPALGNGVSEIWWEESSEYAGLTTRWKNSACEIVECDIWFNTLTAFTTSLSPADVYPYGGPKRPFRNTAVHELGHAEGCGHNANEYNVMGQSWTHVHSNGNAIEAYPGEDFTAGSVAVYGAVAAPFEDVALAHWRYDGAAGPYSRHARTRLMDAAGTELSRGPGRELVYVTRAGTQVRFEFAAENLGKSAVTTMVRFWVSRDPMVDAADVLIGSESITLAPDDVDLRETALTLPANLSTLFPRYYLLAQVDADAQIAETNESNNTTHVRFDTEPRPNYAAIAVTGPKRVSRSSSAPIAIDVQARAVGGFDQHPAYAIYLSKDRTLDASDIRVFAGAFAPDSGSIEAHCSAQLPEGTPKGKYRWLFHVEPVPGETDISDNTVVGGKVKVKR